MPSFIALLRGINVSGKNKLPMKELQAICEGLGWAGVRTYIQSGNLVFEHSGADGLSCALSLRDAIADRYGYDVPVLVLAAEDLLRVWNGNPFLTDASREKAHLHISFLAQAPEPAQVEKLLTYSYPPDSIRITQDAVYLHCPEGYGNTKFHNAFLENKLKVSATTRNLNTVRELLNMLGIQV